MRLASLTLPGIAAAMMMWRRRRSPQRGEDTPERARRLHGFEVFPGVGTPLSRTTRYGATFVAAGSGGTVMLGWVNYTPIFFKPGTECRVVGGRWLLLTRGWGPRTLLRGSFSGGTVRWNKDAKIAEAALRLRAASSISSHRGRYDAGTLQAGLNHLPFPPAPPRIGGLLTLGQRGG